MRLFLDANVLFSAAYREAGSVRLFFRLAEAGMCSLASSPYALDEALRNIARKHPERIDDLGELIARLQVCAEATKETLEWAASQGLPMKDAPILAAAVQSGADALVTGDQTHFGHLFGRTLRGTRVLQPVAAIEHVLARM